MKYMRKKQFKFVQITKKQQGIKYDCGFGQNKAIQKKLVATYKQNVS